MDITKLVGVLGVVAAIGLAGLFGFSNVEQNEIHVVQNLVTGKVFAQTTPGWYFSGCHSVKQFAKSETFFFTSDAEGGKGDWSIEVQFNDGAKANVSGTCRIVLPTDEKSLLNLVGNNYTNWEQIEERLVLPVVRKAVILTANSMSSKESYSDLRSTFIANSWDQIEKGPYVLRTKDEKIPDPISGALVTKIVKEIVKDEKGVAIREQNPLEPTGVHLSNFEIKKFKYEDQVEKQIQVQQVNTMAVQTAKAEAQKAEQDALTAEANGKANVMKAKYVKEEEKMTEVTTAEKKVAVAELAKKEALIVAGQAKEVATVVFEQTEIEKKSAIAKAEGEAEARKLILFADGALAQKLALAEKINASWAEAYSKRPVPTIVMGSGEKGGNTSSDAIEMMDMLKVKLAKDLMVDLNVNAPTPSAPAARK